VTPRSWSLLLALALIAPGPRSAQTSLPTAREVIARHVAAVGGEAVLQRTHSRKVWAHYEIPARRLRGSLELYTARPDKRLLKVELPGQGTDVTGYDGARGWTKKPAEALKAVVGPELEQLRDESVFDFDLHPDSLYRSMTVVEKSRFENRECWLLQLVSRTGRVREEYYDVETGLFAGQVFRRATAQGDVTVRIIASKYRLYDGIRIPSRLSIRSAGVEQIVTVIGVEHNRVNASVFELRRGTP
jgi:hypothetical protein